MKKITSAIAVTMLMLTGLLAAASSASAAPLPSVTAVGSCTDDSDSLSLRATKASSSRIRLYTRLTVPDGQLDDNWIVLKWRTYPIYRDLFANYNVSGNSDFDPYRSDNYWSDTEYVHDYSGWDRFTVLAIDGNSGEWCRASVSIR